MASPPVMLRWGVTALMVGALAAAGAAVAGAAPDVARPSEMLLAVYTEEEHRNRLAVQAQQVVGVKAVALVARTALRLIRSWDVGGRAVDEAQRGYAYPLDAMLFEPVSFSRLAGNGGSLVASLAEGDALLGATSAEVRRIGPGGRLELENGTFLTVRGIVDDALIQNREIALAVPALHGLDQGRRSLLIRWDGPDNTIEEQLRLLVPVDARLLVRTRDPSESIPSWAAILPQARIKLDLGEFAFQPANGRSIRRDPKWERNSLRTAQVPILGRVRCHSLVLESLTGAMSELQERGLAFLVHADTFRGCDNPRLIAVGRGLSRHAWGAAVDLNYSQNPDIQSDASDPRLVDVMAKWGFTSGHLFFTPDPGHFEYAGPPRR